MKIIPFSGSYLTPTHLKGQIRAQNQAEGGQKHKIGNIEESNAVRMLKLLQYVVCIYVYLLATNLYYIFEKFEHSNCIIFLNIADFMFLTPFSLIFGPLFDLLGVLESSNYQKI